MNTSHKDLHKMDIRWIIDFIIIYGDIGTSISM
jgi:hypothetical protein